MAWLEAAMPFLIKYSGIIENLTYFISASVWSGFTAGVGAAFLFPKMSFCKAALIGGGSVAVSAITTVTTASIAEKIFSHSQNPEEIAKQWTWTGLIPLIAIPYFAGVSKVVGISLVAFGILGVYLKKLKL